MSRISRRITELLEILDGEKGGDTQFEMNSDIQPVVMLGDITTIGPIQSMRRFIAHGPVGAVAAVFSSVTFVAGPFGAWVGPVWVTGGSCRMQFVAQSMANLIAVNCEREDVISPGLIPAPIEDFNFGSAAYDASIGNRLPLGGALQGGTQAAPSAGFLLVNQAGAFLKSPIFVPPNKGWTICGTTANATIDPVIVIVEALAFQGRQQSDR